MNLYRLIYLLLTCFLLPCESTLAATNSANTRIIQIDAQQTAGKLDTFFKTSIGAGRANEGLRADWQQQLAQIKKDAGFKYIRMHGLLTDDMGVYREDAEGNPQYNFQYIDMLYDYLLSIDMKPFVELGFMPSALASGDKTVFWWKGNVTPPKDYTKWGNLIRALTIHLTNRYGAEEVKDWYFEVWNEPNLADFWAGSQAEYFKLYATAAKAIKSVNADYRVGGPATAGAAWIPEIITYCREMEVPLDFISTHTYGVRQGYLDEFGTTGTILAKDDGAVRDDVLRSRQQISESSMPNLELHYTEWSSSYTPADPVHDSYHSAAYILQKLKQAGSATDSMSYWVFTDIFEEPGPRFTPFHGGFGLMNYQGIKKPAYFSYEFLNRLGPIELKNTDTASWATTAENGDIQVLLWDYSHTLPEGINNQQYYIQSLPAKEKGTARVNITGLNVGEYHLTVSQVGYKRNDAYSAYIAMGSPAQLNREQVNALKKQADGSVTTDDSVRVSANGDFSIELPVRENDVYLLELSKRN